MNQINLFIGEEAEGPRQGTPTLFIPNIAQVPSIREIKSIIKEYAIKSVYFGAGNIQGMPLPLLPELACLPQDLACTIECNKMTQVAEIAKHTKALKQHFKHVHILFVIPVKDTSLFGCVTDIKLIDDKQLIWIPVQEQFETKLNDIRYNKDKEVYCAKEAKENNRIRPT